MNLSDPLFKSGRELQRLRSLLRFLVLERASVQFFTSQDRDRVGVHTVKSGWHYGDTLEEAAKACGFGQEVAELRRDV